MYKGIHNNSGDLKFNPIDIKKKPEEEKEQQDTNSNDDETIRKLMKGTYTRMKNKYYLSIIFMCRSCR